MADVSQEDIQKTLLDNISDNYQKTIGFPTYDILRAFSFGLSPFYGALEQVAGKLDVDNLSGEELERYTKQRRNVKRKQATFATVTLTVTGTGTVEKGDLFETKTGAQFAAVETAEIVETGNVLVQAVTSGTAGNVAANTITQIPQTIQGITACTNEQPAAGGYEAETDDSLRERYYEAVQQPATSGNIYHYMQWAKEVEGVGDAKVFPLWNGDNTVKVTIINSDKQPADSALVKKVQDYIDPNSSGTGEGEAPIGAYCTIVSAAAKTITVSANIQLLAGYEKETVEATIKKGITGYLQSIAFKQDYVSYGKIANEINDADGVKDYSGLFVNGGTANIEVAEEEVATLGEVVLIVS